MPTDVTADLDLESPASVAHWPLDRRDTTLGVLLIRMVAETAQHAGHADIVRELIDGKTVAYFAPLTWEARRWALGVRPPRAVILAFRRNTSIDMHKRIQGQLTLADCAYDRERIYYREDFSLA